MPPFRFVQPVRFGDVDHAGIVYYPHFFHYFHVAFEELFGPGEYRRILDERQLAFPAVRVECDFHRPLRYGDPVDVEVSLVRLGRSSVALRYRVLSAADAQPLAEATITCATIDRATFRAVPVPGDLRRLFASLS